MWEKVNLSLLIFFVVFQFFSCSSSSVDLTNNNAVTEVYEIEVLDTLSSHFYSTCYELGVTITGTLDDPELPFNIESVDGNVEIFSDDGCTLAIAPTDEIKIPVDSLKMIYVKLDGNGTIAFTRIGGTYVFNYPLIGSFRPATLDETFGTTGLTLSGRIGDDYVYELYVDADENILVAGGCHPVETVVYTTGDACLFRFTKEGILDATFGTGGQVVLDLTGVGAMDEIYDLAIDSNGRYVVTGYGLFGGQYRAYVARFLTNGSLDTSFGTNSGYSLLSAMGGLGNYSAAYGIAIQPVDEKIVITGAKYLANYDVFLMRISSDGKTLDMGPVYKNITGSDLPRDLLMQEDGKFVIVGWSTDDGSGTPAENQGFILRYTAAGALDTSFSTDGVVTGIFGSATRSEVRSVKELDDNSLLISGGMGASTDISAFIIKLQSNGAVDTSFATSGILTVTNATGSSFATDEALYLQNDGKIIFGFGAECTNVEWPFDCKFGLGRVNSNGSWDTDFGTNGKAIYEMSPGQNSLPTGLSVQNDGRVIASGYYENGTDYDIAIYRFWP